MNVRECLKTHYLLFDGAMGTYYNFLYPRGERTEAANRQYPARIRAIHRAYLSAGAMAVKTNTFSPFDVEGETLAQTLEAGYTLACEAAAPFDAAVFADLGPADPDDLLRAVDGFLSLGANHFLFETFSDFSGLDQIAAHIKAERPEAFIITSFAVSPDGLTRHGLHAETLLRQANDCSAIDAAGMNCVSGPSHLLRLTAGLREMPERLSVMPNAGYPAIVRGQTVYEGTPGYFAGRMAEIGAAGARILGGCCGTTPEFIRKTREALDTQSSTVRISSAAHNRSTPAAYKGGRNRLAEKFAAGQRIIAVELDPPVDADVSRFMEGAQRLVRAGADTVTIADCPIARPRVDACMLAAKLRRELGIDPIPHMTCRDRNINATRALLLGLSIEGVRNVLTVTGDPVPTAERDEVKSVFSFHSAILADYIRRLGEENIVAPFQVFGALSVNAANFDAELRKAQRKREAGVCGFLTQPVMSDRAFENLAQAHEAMPDMKILGGVIPVVSERNALFMNNEVAGIEVPDEIVTRYHGLDREQSEALAVELSAAFAKRMLPYTAGWYFMTPFQRVSLIERILAAL